LTITNVSAIEATATTARLQRGCLPRRWRSEASKAEKRRMRKTGGRCALVPRVSGES
jgi:hypothetical protein